MRSFIVFLCLVPTLLFARQTQLETQLKEAIKGKKAEIGIAVIIDGKDTVTVNNDIHYPLMSVFKFHQALALADYMGKQKQSLETRLPIKKSDLKPDTYSPLRDKYPQGGIEKKEAAIHISNLNVVDPKTGKPTRVGRKEVDGKLVRYAKKSGEEIK